MELTEMLTLEIALIRLWKAETVLQLLEFPARKYFQFL